MSNIRSRVSRVYRNENGSAAAEFALVVTGVAALSVAFVSAFGGMTGGSLADSCDRLDGNPNGTCDTVRSVPASSPAPSQN